MFMLVCVFFFFKQKTAYEMRISDCSSDVCSSDLVIQAEFGIGRALLAQQVARRHAGAFDELDKKRPCGGRLQIFDDMRLHSGVADHGERVARRPALRIVIDNDVGHGLVLQQQASSARSGSHSSARPPQQRSEEHTSELQSLMRTSYAVF